MLRSDIFCESVGAIFDILWWCIWPNAAVFSQFSAILHMRSHRRWIFIVVSHTLCKGRFHACHKITPWFINHEICHNEMNLNPLEINHDHFPSMPWPNFRLSGGSLGYWTACNNFKRYCTLPYCEVSAAMAMYWPISPGVLNIRDYGDIRCDIIFADGLVSSWCQESCSQHAGVFQSTHI